MDHRTTNRPFSYLRPTLQMPSPYLERVLFPNSPRVPEKDSVRFTDSEVVEGTAATPSEPSRRESKASAAVKRPFLKTPATKPQSAKTTAEETPVRRKAVAMAPAAVATDAKTTVPMTSARGTDQTSKKANLFSDRESNPLFFGGSSFMTAEEEPDGYRAIEKDTGEDEVTQTKGSQATTGTAEEGPIRRVVNYVITAALDTFKNLDLTGASDTLKNLDMKRVSAQSAVVVVVSTLLVCFVVILVAGLVSGTGSDHNSAGSSGNQLLPVGGGGKKVPSSRGVVKTRAEDSQTTEEPETPKQTFTLVDYEETKVPGGDPANPPAFECDTDACRWQRRLVDEKLDQRLDPCVDFYSYVCSSAWELNGDLPYRAAGKAFLIKQVTRYLQEHMHIPPEEVGHGEHNFLDHSSLLLSACLNNTAPRDVSQWDGVRGLLRMVGLEDWPYLEPPLLPPGQSFRLDRVLKLVDLQLAVFPIVYVSLRKFEESGRYVLHVDAPRNFLFVQYELQKDNESMPYKETVRQTLVLWKTLPDSNSMADDIVRFERQLLEASEPFVKAAWAKNAAYATEKFPRLPKFNVAEYLLYLRKSSKQAVVLNPAYLSKLSTILKKQTPRTILNFVGFLVIVQVAPLLPYELIPRDLIRMGYPSFQHDIDARTQSCFHMVNRLFPHGVRWIVRDILARTTDLDRQWTATTKKMVSSLAHTFRSGTTWMHNDDVASAIERLKSLHVGYLAGQEPEEDIDHYYASVNATYRPNSLVRYYGKLLAASLRKYWESSGGGANYDARFTERSTDLEVAWTRSPESALRVYLTSSSVVAASLVTHTDYPSTLFPLLAADVTQALFLASLDDPQWSSWTQDRFHALQYCLLERYKRGVRRANASASHVRGFLADILADNAAIKPLMDAFRRFSHGAVFVPGRRADRLTIERLFYVNYAAGYCVSKKEEGQIRERLRYRLNLPPRVRVNLALLDLKEFRDTFGCPHQLGASRCPVWNREETAAAEV